MGGRSERGVEGRRAANVGLAGPPGGALPGLGHAAAWSAIPLLFVTVSAVRAFDAQAHLGRPELVLALNLVFLAAVPALVAVLVTRSFLRWGDAGLLLLCGGIVVWGLASSAAGAAALQSADATVAIHNAGALLAGASHALAAALLQDRSRIVVRRRAAVAITWSAAVAAQALLAVLALRGALPVFFVDGRGGTPLRQVVLGAAVAAWAVGAAGLARGGSRSGFRRWYSLGMGLIAVGLYGVLVQEAFGGLVGWLGRIAQYLGGLAMLAATVRTVRESRSWALPLGALLRQTEARHRALFENMSEGLLLAERADVGGRRELTLTDLNPAGETLTGLRRAETQGRPLLELLPALDPAILEACDRVLRTGAPVRVAAPAPDGVRHLDVVAFAPEPDGLALLLSDDSDRRRAEQALLDANARLRDLDRHRTRFLSVLSHELRNPLAPIRNAAATLERADPDSPPAQRAREILARQVDHLTRLVDELLDLNRISTGKIRLQQIDLDLCELVRRAGEDQRDSFAGRGIRFTMELPRERLWASGDPARLTQVIGNLLQNSAKFTPAGGAVTLALAPIDGGAELRVHDTGVGIEPALLPQLFDPFVQGEATLARSEGGLGLGLALVKGLVELHGGSIEARSEGPGLGAELIVRLPTLVDVPLSASAPGGTSPAAL